MVITLSFLVWFLGGTSSNADPAVGIDSKERAPSVSIAPIQGLLHEARTLGVPTDNTINIVSTNEEKLAAIKLLTKTETLEALEVSPKRMRTVRELSSCLELDIKLLRKEFRIESPSDITNAAIRTKYYAEEANIVNEAIESAVKLLSIKQRKLLQEMNSHSNELTILKKVADQLL
jgi:hypothetical protein